MAIQAAVPRIFFIDNKKLIKSLFYVRSQLPTLVLEKLAKIPFIGSPELTKNVALLKMANGKLNDMYELFSHFTLNQWIYENKKVYEFEAMMTPAEREEFYIDPKTFDWRVVTQLYGFGVSKYMFKDDAVEPDGKSLMLIHKNHFRYFDDIKRAFVDLNIIC